jgi:hypothetical protein
MIKQSTGYCSLPFTLGQDRLNSQNSKKGLFPSCKQGRNCNSKEEYNQIDRWDTKIYILESYGEVQRMSAHNFDLTTTMSRQFQFKLVLLGA